MKGLSLLSAPYVALLGKYRPDTLAYKRFADKNGIGFYDLDFIDLIHKDLDLAGIPTGPRPGYHFSCIEFGYKLDGGGKVAQVGCLYQNNLVQVTAGVGPTVVAGGFRGRRCLRFDNSPMWVANKTVNASKNTLSWVGNPGNKTGSFTCIIELTKAYYNGSAWMCGMQDSQLGTELSYCNAGNQLYNVGENSNYAAADRYYLGRTDMAAASGQQVSLQINRAAKNGPVDGNKGTLQGGFNADTIYVGARGGTAYMMAGGLFTMFHNSPLRLADGQLAADNRVAALYGL